MRPHSHSCGHIVTTRRAARPLIFALAAAGLLVGAGSLPAQDDISDLIKRARDNFRPVSEKEAAEARVDVRQRMNEVADFVNPSSQNGQRWFRYLRWDALKQALAEDRTRDFAPFDKTIRQLNRNETGLENPRFR